MAPRKSLDLACRLLQRGSLSVAGAAARAVERGGFWAGAAHPRRQKHREMPPPGASAPAFAATVKPARAHPMQTSKARRALQRVMNACWGMSWGDVWGCVLQLGCFVHRFLISGPDLGIDARFSPFTRSFVHRFLISGGKLGNRCRDCPETAQLLQRCGNENSFACSVRCGDDVPSPILISVVAKENGSACYGRSDNVVRVRY